MSIENLISSLTSTDDRARRDAVTGAALALEVAQLSVEEREIRRSEYGSLGYDWLFYAGLGTDVQKSLVEALSGTYQRTRDPAVIWALGKAESETALREIDRLVLSEEWRDEEIAWQAACAVEVALNDRVELDPVLLQHLKRFTDTLSASGTHRLIEMAGRLRALTHE